MPAAAVSDDDLVSSYGNDDYDDDFFNSKIDSESESKSVLSNDDDDVQPFFTLASSNVAFEWPKDGSKSVKWESPAEATDIQEKILRLNPIVHLERNITKYSSPRGFYDLFITKDIWENTFSNRIVQQLEKCKFWKSQSKTGIS